MALFLRTILKNISHAHNYTIQQKFLETKKYKKSICTVEFAYISTSRGFLKSADIAKCPYRRIAVNHSQSASLFDIREVFVLYKYRYMHYVVSFTTLNIHQHKTQTKIQYLHAFY